MIIKDVIGGWCGVKPRKKVKVSARVAVGKLRE